MPQEVLYRAEIRSAFEKVRGEAVPQHMGCNPTESCPYAQFTEDAAH